MRFTESGSHLDEWRFLLMTMALFNLMMGWNECQNQPNGQRCVQSRVKAEIIFDRIADEFSRRSTNLNQLRYRRYLVAVHAFSKKKKAELGSEKKRVNNALTKAETEKQKLVSQRADNH